MIPSTTRPATPLVTGIVDVHHSDPDGDYPRAMREGGLVALLHKLTQGKDWTDKEFAAAMARAKTAGLLRGAYHFGSNSSSGAQQAEFFVATLRRLVPEPDDVLCALDFEHNPDPRGGDMTVENARAFVVRVSELTGRWPLFYTGASRLHGLRLAAGDVLGNCPLWLAQYGEPPRTVPPCWHPAPDGGPGYSLWQYTDYADGPRDQAKYPRAMPGFGKVDRSVFRGTVDELRTWWRTAGEP